MHIVDYSGSIFDGGKGLTSLGNGVMEHVVTKSGYKMVDSVHFRKVTPWKEVMRRIKDSTSADGLNCRARLVSEHRISARLIGIQGEINRPSQMQALNFSEALLNTDNHETLTKRIRSVMAGSDYQATHCKELNDYLPTGYKPDDQDNRHKRSNSERWAPGEQTRRFLVNSGRFWHANGDIGNGISTFMYEMLNNATSPSRARNTFTTRFKILVGGIISVGLITINARYFGSNFFKTAFVGWFVWSAIKYAAAVVSRGVSRYVISPDVKFSNDPLSKAYMAQMIERKNKTLCAIIKLLYAIKNCPADEELVRKALEGKVKGITTKNSGDLLSQLMQSENILELQNVLQQHLSPDRYSGRELIRREEEFVAIANLVEHRKISGYLKESDKTARQKLQESTLISAKGLPFYYRAQLALYKSFFQVKHQIRQLVPESFSFHASKCEDQRIKEKACWREFKGKKIEATRACDLAVAKRDAYITQKIRVFGDGTHKILKDKYRHYAPTLMFAYLAQCSRYIGQQVILSSDTVLGRVCGNGIEKSVKLITGKNMSVLNSRAAGMILGVCGIAGILLFAGPGMLDLFMAPVYGVMNVTLGGAVLGGSGFKLTFLSLSLMSAVFMLFSAAFDGLAKGSLSIFGAKIDYGKDIHRYGELGPKSFGGHMPANKSIMRG